MPARSSSLPPFLVAKEANAGNEAMQDFFLRWTIECAHQKYALEYKLLNEYARRVVYLMIFGEHDSANEDQYTVRNSNSKIEYLAESFEIGDITTHRQLNLIDLVAEITLTNGETYVLNIENKFYSSIGNNQLEKAKDFINNRYRNQKKVHLVIFADSERTYGEKDKSMRLRKRILEAGYKFPSIDFLAKLAGFWEIKNNLGPYTGNYLFDEFWFKGYRAI